ncbi:TPA: hypothetical protein ACTYZB_004780 [Klebsiella variicola]
MIESFIARFKAYLMTAAAVIALLLGAYVLGGRSARRSIEIRSQQEENKRLKTTVEVKNDVMEEIKRKDDAAVDAELNANWLRD